MERDTRQRRAIREAFLAADRPLSPPEVLETAGALAPGLNLSTVYRNLRGLEAEGWLVPVELPGEPARYEVAGKGHHHHFRCRACQRVYEVGGCPGGLAALTPAGFRLERHEVVLYGVCASCAPAA